MLNRTGEKGQGTPAEVYGLPSQAALRTWALSATPRKWAPDTAVCHQQPQEGVNTSKCCIRSMPKMTLLPHLYLATGREGNSGDSSTLGMVNAWDQAMWRFLLCLPGRLKMCLLILSLDICLLWVFCF